MGMTNMIRRIQRLPEQLSSLYILNYWLLRYYGSGFGILPCCVVDKNVHDNIDLLYILQSLNRAPSQPPSS